jgi:hypothetical protein
VIALLGKGECVWGHSYLKFQRMTDP